MSHASAFTERETRPILWFVCPYFGRTSEVWMYRQATGIQHFDVRVITGLREHAEQFPWEPSALEIIPDLGDLPPTRLGRVWTSLKNFRYGFFPRTRKELSWWIRKIETESPDVILCQYGLTGVKLAPIAAAMGVPLVTHFHGFDISSHLSQLGYRWRLRRTLPRMAGCVVVASFQEPRLVALGAAEERIRVISCGVPIDQFAVRRGRPRASCRFLCVCRFVEKKAPQHTLRAFALCAKEIADSELRMIGDGPLLELCQELAKSLGVSDRVRFLGAQPIEVVRDELAAADVFVLHSVTGPDGDMEGWPVSIAEACASGLPIVSTRHAGIVDQVEEGTTGYLVDEHDWQTMAQRMIELARDPDLRSRMGAASRAKIETFDVRHQIEKLETFLLECAGRKGA